MFYNCSRGISCLFTNCNNSKPNDLACRIFKHLIVKRIDRIIMVICTSVSVVCLLLHIVVTKFFPKRRKPPSKMFDSLVLTLVLSQILFLCGVYPVFELPTAACYGLAVLIHYFQIVSFFWMNAVSIDICNTFSNASLKNYNGNKYFKYASFVWGSGILIVGLAILADFTDIVPNDYRPHFAARPQICWMGSRKGMVVFFNIPVFIIVTVNTVLFATTVCWFQKQHRSSETLKSYGRKEYNRLWLYMKLSTIMGASWVFGLIKFFTNSSIYRYLFTAFSALQGAFIFIMFDLKAEENFVFLGFRKFRQRGRSGTYDQVTVTTSNRHS